MRPKSLHRQSPRTGEVRIECGESLCTGRALAPARSASNAAKSLCTGRALAPARSASNAAKVSAPAEPSHRRGPHRMRPKSLHRQSPRTGEARSACGNTTKHSHRRGPLRKRQKVSAPAEHATAAYDGVQRRIFFLFEDPARAGRATTAHLFFRRPRTSGARYDGASFFFEDLARAGRATTAHLFFYDPRSSEGGNELDAQSPTTPHPHAHVCYSTASSTTTQKQRTTLFDISFNFFFHQSNTDTLLRGRATGKRDRNANGY